MVSLKRLRILGYTPTFFKLPEAVMTYYTFDNSILSRQPSFWNIVGLYPQRGKEPFLELQILYIDEEALLYEPFSALQDAGNFLSIHLDELQAFIQLLEETCRGNDLSVEDAFTRFSLMSEQELAELKFDQKEIQQRLGNYYKYHPVPSIQTADRMSVIGLPSWTGKGKSHASSSLIFATFDCERLKNPTFQLPYAEWLGSMRFDRRALSEFIFLLKQRMSDALQY
ncbi:MAG TPA: hypothetical protein VFV38_33670 [Ktedonobacteraceae bacterium]|nr:hypothetical protein [Ktedonobacteraceae bacterium]